MSRKLPFSKSAVAKLMFELAVVFIGVLLAFIVNEYREEQKAAQRSQQLREALTAEINIYLRGASVVEPEFKRRFDSWQTDYDTGKQPPLPRLNISGVSLPPRGIWNAVMASDPLATLNIATMDALSQYYNALDLVLAKHAALENFASARIVPALEAENQPFYSASGKLSPEFADYIAQMRDLLALMDYVHQMGEQSVGILQSAPTDD